MVRLIAYEAANFATFCAVLTAGWNIDWIVAAIDCLAQ